MTSEAEAVLAVRDVPAETDSPRGGRRLRPRTVARFFEAFGGIFLFVSHSSKPGGAVSLLENLASSADQPACSVAGASPLSGSPVAAVGTTLLAGGVLSKEEAFAVIGGSRLGASFIVLAIGYVFYVTGKRNSDGLSIGVIALITTFTTQGPAVVLGLVSLHYGWLDPVQFSPPPGMLDWIDTVYGPPVDFLNDRSLLGIFAAGVGFLLGSFALFDRALSRRSGSPGFASGGAMDRAAHVRLGCQSPR